MSAAYGIQRLEENDEHLRMIEDTAHIAERIASPGHFAVDAIPVLRYLPSWFPGGSFKKQAVQWKNRLHEIERLPYDWAKVQIVSTQSIYEHVFSESIVSISSLA